jgi:titin
LPADPTIGAVSVASANSIVVNWTAPAGNPSITSYKVTPFIGVTAQTATTGLSPATITGLTKGTAYTFKVAAVTVSGTGAMSAASAAITPSTAPSDISSLVANPTTTASVTVSWSAPADNGGLTVNYKIERSLVSDSSGWVTLVATQTATTYTNNVLVNAQPAPVAGTKYWYRVTPFNIPTTGVNVLGNTSAAVGTNTLPAAPTTVTVASVDNTTARVTFVAPTGNADKTYRVTPYVAGVAVSALTVSGASSTPVDVPNLTNGTTYTFKVAAVTPYSSSADSAASASFLMAMVPDQVAGVSATPVSATSVRLNWTAAPANNGSALTYYRVESSINSGSSWTILSSLVSAAALTYSATVATNVIYQFRVSALNAKGVGAPSSVVTSSSLPATPTGTPTVAVTGVNTANVTFTCISGLSYNIVPLLSGTVAQTTIAVGPVTGTSTTVPTDALSNSYGCYKFKIQAVNTYGSSAAYGSLSAMAYFGSSVAAPAGNAYIYDSASYVIGTSTVSYTATLMADATIVPTSVGWSVTAGGATDTLIGVKRVVFSDQSAYLFGSGSGGSIDSMNNLSAAVQAVSSITPGGKNGDIFLFSRGETYIRNNSSEWYIDLSGITLKGVGDPSLAKPILIFNNTAGWPAHIMEHVDGVVLQDLQISGGNKTRSYNLLKVAGASNPIGLIKNVTFTGVDFINVGSKSIDFHYVHGVTMTNCTFGAATNDKTLTFTSCHDVVMTNCTVERSTWNSVSILTSDGPNYLWNNNTSTLWSATEAERLDALNNKNFDFSTSTFNSDASGNLPLIILDLHRNVTTSGGYARGGLPANLTDMSNNESEYQVSMSYFGASPALKLPAAMSVAYSGLIGLYPAFLSPTVRFTSSIDYSSPLLRQSQWPATAYPNVQVFAVPSGVRMYPDGYPRSPAEIVADQEALLATDATSVLVEVDGTQVDVPFVEKDELDSDPAVTTAAEGAPLLVKDGDELVPAIKTDVSVDAYESNAADEKLAAAMQKAVDNEMSDIIITRIKPGDTESTTSLLPVGTMSDDLTVATTDNSKSLTLELPSATYANGSPMPTGSTAATAEVSPRTDGVLGMNIFVKVSVDGTPVTSGFSIPIEVEDQTAAGAAGYALSHYNGTAWVQLIVLDPVPTAGNNYTFAGILTENQDYRGVQAGAPDAPAKPTTVEHDSSITVLFNAPNSNNAAITSYKIYWVGDNQTSGFIDASGSPATVTGLTDGVNYTFSVAAVNAVDEGADSIPSDPVQTISTPGVPQNVSVTTGNASFVVSWSAPQNAVNADISGYIVAYVDKNNVTTTSGYVTSPYTVTGLINNDSYNVYVYAVSKTTGNGATSSFITVIPLGKPGAPSLSAKASSKSVIITITPPTDDGSNGAGASLTYKIYKNGVLIAQQAGLSYTDVPPTIDTQIIFKATASNAAATSNYSSDLSVIYRDPICFLANAPVLTPNGYRRIDSLRVGDRVKTAAGESMKICRIKVNRYEPSTSVNPYVIPKGMFGAKERLYISPTHCVAVPGRGMVKACELGLRQWKMREAFDYYNIELEKWSNIVVAGVEVESLAPLYRITLTTEQFKKFIALQYKKLTPEIYNNLMETCIPLGNNLVNVPVMKK